MPAPTWNDTYQTWLAQHKAAFGGQDINRDWNRDPDAQAQKQALDRQYLADLEAYSQRTGEQVAPDQSMLGLNVQPNTFTETDHSHDGFFGGLAKSLGMSTNDLGALAALAAGGYGLYSSGLLGGAAGGAGSTAAGTGASSLGNYTLGSSLGSTAGAAAGDYTLGSALGSGATGLGGVGAGAGATAGNYTLGSALGSNVAGLGGAGAAAGGLSGSAGSLWDTATGFLKENPTIAKLGGAALGALSAKDQNQTSTSTRDPWGPAQQYLKDNLATNAAMQKHYQANPFSTEQQGAYQGLLNTLANNQANGNVLLGNASKFGQSSRGQVPQMAGLLTGTQAPIIDWAKYQNIGLLGG